MDTRGLNRVLIVDDDLDACRYLVRVLTNHLKGTHLKFANDGHEAIRLAHEWHPDVIIQDLHLGSLSGIDVLWEVKNNPDCRDTHVMMVSSDNSADAIDSCLEKGASDYVLKPIRVKELVLRTRRLLEDCRNRRQLVAMNARLKKEKTQLSQYFSSDMVERIVAEDSVAEMSGTKGVATIMFIDLRNSTAIAESVQPQEFAEFLSEFQTDVMDLVYGHQGAVNKLLGDGLLVTFGVPIESGDDAVNAVRCALAIVDYLATYNDVRPEFLTAPLKLGIGIATGEVFHGSIGSIRRSEYTVLGDAVNVAARLESLTKKAGQPILLDSETRDRIAGWVDCNRADIDKVRGRSGPVSIFYPVDSVTGA